MHVYYIDPVQYRLKKHFLFSRPPLVHSNKLESARTIGSLPKLPKSYNWLALDWRYVQFEKQLVFTRPIRLKCAA